MFEVGFTEIILIMGLALLVLGPERLPDLARKVGRWTGKARAMARQFQNQLEQEVTIEQITRDERRTQAQPTTADDLPLGPDVPETFSDPPPHIHPAAQVTQHQELDPAVDTPSPNPAPTPEIK